MRQIFSIRFFAAIGAVVGLFALLTLVFGGRDSVADLAEERRIERTIDFVEQVFAPLPSPDFEVADDGTTSGSLELVIDGDRRLDIFPGTYGEVDCLQTDRTGQCAVLADLLGDAVVWFALVPMGPGRTVVLPAIESIEAERATLTNGWQLPYAQVLDRRCPREFVSFREFRDELGTAFTSVYSIDEAQLVAVVCDRD
jgi:hypothetical protein